MTDKKNKEKSESAFSPDPETLHTTDPQEKMKGPLSSLANEVREEMEDAGEEKEESEEESGDKK